MATEEKRAGLTRRQFVWSSVAGGVVAAVGKSPGGALAQAKPKAVLRAISVWEKPLIWNKPLDELMARVEKKSGEVVKYLPSGNRSSRTRQSTGPD